MGDVPIRPEPEPQITPADKAANTYRWWVSGDENGRVRRKSLFLIAEIGIVIAIALDGVLGLAAGLLGLAAILLLAMTDDVVTLE